MTVSCDDPRLSDLVHDMLSRIADRWTLLILEALGDGELRFSQLLDRVDGISRKMLTQTLRQLERDGLVVRHVHAVVPPRVDYRLTPMGEQLDAAVCGVWLWAQQHLDAIEAARQEFDAAVRNAG